MPVVYYEANAVRMELIYHITISMELNNLISRDFP